MEEIKGQKIITVSAAIGDEYAISYEGRCRVDIKNGTDGDIYISSGRAFDGKGRHALIASDECYKGLSLSVGKLYIKSDGGGRITVVRLG